MPRRFQFSLAALFWATAAIALGTAVVLAVARYALAATFAWLVGLMVLPMVVLSGAMMLEDWVNRRGRSQRRHLKWLLMFGVVFGLSLPWMLAWLLLSLFPR